MDFSKIKLVATDMDGTLLNSKHEVSARFYTVFEGLKRRNIHFAAASGRQYESIVEKLAPIKDHINIIAENGGVVKQVNKTPVLFNLSPESITDTLNVLRELDEVFIVFCGKKSAYVETKDARFIRVLSQYFPNHTIVSDLQTITDDKILKISAYHFDCSETHIFPAMAQLEDGLQITVSAKHWLDISHANANKGHAIEMLQKDLGISREETIAFGDYDNDLKMLEAAYFSFAMENANENVKNISRFQTKSNDEDGVEVVLEKLI